MLPAGWVERLPVGVFVGRLRSWLEPARVGVIPLPDFQDVSYGLWRPTLDLCESTREFVIRMELAGLEPEQVKVRCEGGILTVSGTREEAREAEEIGFPLRERRFGSFSRSIRLPLDAVLHDLRTDFSHGLLTIRVPKRLEGAEPGFLLS
jgi:HSP20 family molecular chaperone IbpA